jgi:hypothetical protein
MTSVERSSSAIAGRNRARCRPSRYSSCGGRIRRADERDARGEQTREETRQDHRIGDVADEELVEAQHAVLARHLGRDDVERVALRAQGSETRVHVLHIAMKVLAMRRDAGVSMKQVEQERLPASHATPEIDAAHAGCVRAAAQRGAEATDQAAMVALPQPHPQIVEAGDGVELRRIGGEPVPRKRLAIGFAHDVAG